MSAGTTIFQLLDVPEKYIPVVGAGAVAVALTGLGLIVKMKAAKAEQNIAPAPGITVINIATSIVSYFKGLLESIVGHHSEKYVPVVGGIFLFIFLSNISGLLPGWLPPTDNLNTNLGMALCVFLFYNYLAIREHGFGYFKHFTGGLPPPGYGGILRLILGVIAGLVVAIEVIGHAFRPLSLTFRLWGNMNGDHILLGTVSGLIPLILPMAAMALGLFVSLIQALVFSLLTTVYIKLAVSHDH